MENVMSKPGVPFAGIVGQDAVKKLLTQALNSRQFSHAYLFEGPPGLGKETMAREFAAAIFCSHEKPPCHTCKSCRQVMAGSHPEFRWILPENPEKDTSLSVETIRGLIKDIYLKPYESDWKIYVIPQAEIMTPQAQNALLKTLEEPPDHAVIVLATSRPETLLPTVLSRCQTAVFRPVGKQEMEAWLQNRYQIDSHQAVKLAAFANGTPARAVKLRESESFQELRRQLLQLTDTLAAGNISPLLETGEFLAREKSQALEVLAMWQEWVRDLQVLTLKGETALLINQDQEERLRQQVQQLAAQASSQASPRESFQASGQRHDQPVILHLSQGLSNALLLLEQARDDLENHGNLAYVTEVLLLNLLDSFKRPTAAPAVQWLTPLGR
ncbi:DNA polymerase III subunit delta' [Anoxynatronum buryatiense]|uniref:DNA polymerase III, delta prime subunit n=1 Tax=Anoxynatronum buryatiense TaxID=489973 RepID=A0AA45WVZ1_9CLOT|nr:DNA polymerase III subunit delta' [Anoxynatronum buryatiense]SMP56500.1 DNA polymerase III, delta prime subunit [Anoxynatronum buryatiense]